MHLAFTHQPIDSKTSYRVTSIATWKNILFVGTNNGHVYPFRYSNSKDSFIVLEGRSSFPTKRAIAKMAVIAEWQVLLALVGNSLYFCNVTELGEKIEVPGSKGCSLFTWAEHEGKLFVTIKKKICVYEWKGHALGFELQVTNIHNLPDQPKIIQWCGARRLCIGFRQEYDILDMSTGKFTEVLKVKSGTEPVCAAERSADGKKATIVLVNGQQGYVFVINQKTGKIYADTHTGGPVAGGGGRKGGGGGSSIFTWSDTPTAVEFCGPFLLASLPKAIEVHNISNKTPVQQIKLTGMMAVSRLSRDLSSWSYVVTVAQPTRLTQLQVRCFVKPVLIG